MDGSDMVKVSYKLISVSLRVRVSSGQTVAYNLIRTRTLIITLTITLTITLNLILTLIGYC